MKNIRTVSSNDTAVEAGFASLGLSESLLSAITALGYEEPTPIQRAAIPLLLAGRDVLGQAATGTGKTAAFALPMLQRLSVPSERRGTTRGLVLVPTRELAMQVAEAIHKYAKGLGVSVVPVYGGAPMDQQVRALRRGADVVVATPGRTLDHLRRGTVRLEGLQVLVLDEADEMLDMGFAEELEAILSEVPKVRQTALFSATLPPRIVSIAQRHLNDPSRVAIARERPAAGKLPRVRQTAYIVPRARKPAALAQVLELENPTSAIVFCRTRFEVDELAETLAAHGYAAEPLHGGLAQRQRDRVMKLFRAGKVELLVATDVAARGLDIAHLSHVVNYDVPSAPEAYVHRIGRTGRVGRTGIAITLAEPREHRQLRNIEAFTKQKIEVASLPTVADLRVRRLDLTRASLRERLLAGKLDDARPVAQSLAEEFDLMDVAAAAIDLLHEKKGDLAADSGRKTPPVRAGSGDLSGAVARLYIGAGRKSGVRPADLVGAIAGEAAVDPRVLGAIEIADRFSIIEVPEPMAEQIITSLRAGSIRGKKVPIRRDRPRT